MRIISKFNDFYDCIQAYGYDDNCIYKRINRKITIDNIKYRQLEQLILCPKFFSTPDDCPSLKIEWLLYCGKLIPYIIAPYNDVAKPYDERKDFFLYNINDVSSLFTFIGNEYGNKSQKSIELMFNSNTRNSDNKHLWNFNFYKYDVGRILNFGNNIDINDILLDAEVPIAKIHIEKNGRRYNSEIIQSLKYRRKCKLEMNISLAAIQFYRFKHHLEVFNDIENYITQQLGGNSPTIVEVSNENKILKHGFDLKTSFRKPKQKK